jgi:Protein of unknown function (DUF4065)
MQFDRAKLKAVILYTCAKCAASQLGAVKLHKVLYFSDMLHYAHVGAPITGATYRKRALGPTCDQLLSTIRDLDRERALDVREVDYFGFRKKEYVALRPPDIERLSESERSLLDEIIEFVCRNNTAKTISDYSHNRAWDMAEFGDVLPYHSVFHLFPTQVSQEALDWASGEVRKIEAEGPRREALGGTSFRDFRSRVLETRR